jgi:hypothetical protein
MHDKAVQCKVFWKVPFKRFQTDLTADGVQWLRESLALQWTHHHKTIGANNLISTDSAPLSGQ